MTARPKDPATSAMSAEAIRAWRKRLGLKQSEAARALGIARSTLALYEHGSPIPKPVALACAAIALGLTEYPKAVG